MCGFLMGVMGGWCSDFLAAGDIILSLGCVSLVGVSSCFWVDNWLGLCYGCVLGLIS